MRKISSVIMLSVVVLLAGCREKPPADSAPEEAADSVFTNGKIYTVNSDQPWAEAVAVRDGKFVKVGSDADMQSVTGDSTRVIDVKGQFVMPGIIDVHAHPLSVEIDKLGLNIEKSNDAGAILVELKAYADAHPELVGIMGGNWNIGIFAGDSPDKKLLDEVVPDRPVFLLSQTGHSAWVNSKALELAGFDENFENIGTVIVDRYPGSNEPSGTIRELALHKVLVKMGFARPEKVAPAIEEELKSYTKYGITSIQPAEGSPGWIRAAHILEKKGELNVRLFPAMDWITAMLRDQDDWQVEANIGNWKRYRSELINPNYVNILADGGPDARTSLLLEPYAGSTDFCGQMLVQRSKYVEAIPRFHGQGIGVHVHCIGDGAAAEIIRIFEEAVRGHPESKANLHLAHAWMITPEQLAKLSKIPNATVDFSPMLAVPHPVLRGTFGEPLGEERFQRLFNVRSALETGIPVGFGTDFPASLIPEPDSFWYMEGWVTRRVPDHPEYGTLNPSQAITVEQAIEGFTLGGAKALGFGWDEKLGSIEKGKYADFIVLSQNPMEVPQEDIAETKVLKTIFNGREVFDRAKAVSLLDVVDIEISNADLDNAVDAAEPDLLVEDELWDGVRGCFHTPQTLRPSAGADSAPDEVNEAFAALTSTDYEFIRPARTVYWKNTDTTYWIQWTVKDDVAVLWAYDPQLGRVVEILQVGEK